MLHRAAWVVPVSSPPIPNGAVLVRNHTVLSVGDHGTVQAQCPPHTLRVDHGSKALIPALVNAHTHLELSAFEGTIPFPQESFASWLRELLPRRPGLSPEQEKDALLQGKRRLTASGTGLYGDIANRVNPPYEMAGASPEAHVFVEVLGFNQDDLGSAVVLNGLDAPDALDAMNGARQNGFSYSFAAHACYSASAEIILQSKEWCRKRGAPFSIHAAEHLDEVEFLSDGTGFCRQLLESLGRWSPHWKPPRLTPVEYLKELGVLDGRTILVHAVHMTGRDWEIVAEHGCFVCFCPRSNYNVSAGRADMEAPLGLGIPMALGTDSLASNSDLNLFSEASYVLDHYPSIPPEAVLSMITLGGARALRREDRHGAIGAGKSATFLSVAVPHPLNSSSQLMEIIIRQGKEGAWQWANSPMNG